MTPDKTKIRNAATIIVVRNKNKNPSVLMGQRGINAAFMPSGVVFYGGAVDDEDLLINFENQLTMSVKLDLKKIKMDNGMLLYQLPFENFLKKQVRLLV